MNNAGISRSTLEVEKGKESAEALSKEMFNDSWEEWEEIYRTNVIRSVGVHSMMFAFTKIVLVSHRFSLFRNQLLLHVDGIPPPPHQKSISNLYSQRPPDLQATKQKLTKKVSTINSDSLSVDVVIDSEHQDRLGHILIFTRSSGGNHLLLAIPLGINLGLVGFVRAFGCHLGGEDSWGDAAVRVEKKMR